MPELFTKGIKRGLRRNNHEHVENLNSRHIKEVLEPIEFGGKHGIFHLDEQPEADKRYSKLSKVPNQPSRHSAIKRLKSEIISRYSDTEAGKEIQNSDLTEGLNSIADANSTYLDEESQTEQSRVLLESQKISFGIKNSKMSKISSLDRLIYSIREANNNSSNRFLLNLHELMADMAKFESSFEFELLPDLAESVFWFGDSDLEEFLSQIMEVVLPIVSQELDKIKENTISSEEDRITDTKFSLTFRTIEQLHSFRLFFEFLLKILDSYFYQNKTLNVDSFILSAHRLDGFYYKYYCPVRSIAYKHLEFIQTLLKQDSQESTRLIPWVKSEDYNVVIQKEIDLFRDKKVLGELDLARLKNLKKLLNKHAQLILEKDRVSMREVREMRRNIEKISQLLGQKRLLMSGVYTQTGFYNSVRLAHKRLSKLVYKKFNILTQQNFDSLVEANLGYAVELIEAYYLNPNQEKFLATQKRLDDFFHTCSVKQLQVFYQQLSVPMEEFFEALKDELHLIQIDFNLLINFEINKTVAKSNIINIGVETDQDIRRVMPNKILKNLNCVLGQARCMLYADPDRKIKTHETLPSIKSKKFEIGPSVERTVDNFVGNRLHPHKQQLLKTVPDDIEIINELNNFDSYIGYSQLILRIKDELTAAAQEAQRNYGTTQEIQARWTIVNRYSLLMPHLANKLDLIYKWVANQYNKGDTSMIESIQDLRQNHLNMISEINLLIERIRYENATKFANNPEVKAAIMPLFERHVNKAGKQTKSFKLCGKSMYFDTLDFYSSTDHFEIREYYGSSPEAAFHYSQTSAGEPTIRFSKSIKGWGSGQPMHDHPLATELTFYTQPAVLIIAGEEVNVEFGDILLFGKSVPHRNWALEYANSTEYTLKTALCENKTIGNTTEEGGEFIIRDDFKFKKFKAFEIEPGIREFRHFLEETDVLIPSTIRFHDFPAGVKNKTLETKNDCIIDVSQGAIEIINYREVGLARPFVLCGETLIVRPNCKLEIRSVGEMAKFVQYETV
ncbi:MAG: hypothetical protein OHK0017_08640 [Patescibacteria group bacterium]